jgi:hypothetical protein
MLANSSVESRNCQRHLQQNGKTLLGLRAAFRFGELSRNHHVDWLLNSITSRLSFGEFNWNTSCSSLPRSELRRTLVLDTRGNSLTGVED